MNDYERLFFKTKNEIYEKISSNDSNFRSWLEEFYDLHISGLYILIISVQKNENLSKLSFIDDESYSDAIPIKVFSCQSCNPEVEAEKLYQEYCFQEIEFDENFVEKFKKTQKEIHTGTERTRKSKKALD